MDFVKRFKRSELDNRFNLPFKQNGQDDDIGLHGFAQTGLHFNVIGRNVPDDDSFLFESALPDLTLSETKFIGNGFSLSVSLSSKQFENVFVLERVCNIKHALL